MLLAVSRAGRPSQRRQRLPKVAPFESCVACLRGDTNTGLALEGEGEWVIAGLMRMEIPKRDATVLVEDAAVERYGCDPGKLPVEVMQIPYRVCAECAAKAGLTVGPVETPPLYRQPEEQWSDDARLHARLVELVEKVKERAVGDEVALPADVARALSDPTPGVRDVAELRWLVAELERFLGQA